MLIASKKKVKKNVIKMKNKALISIFVLLFVTSFFTSAVNAASESKTLQDNQGDVKDEAGNPVTGKDQYDIDKIIYTNNNGLVIIEIKLHGVFTESDNNNITATIYFITSLQNSYMIAYDGIDVYGQLLTVGTNESSFDVNFEGIGTSSLKFTFSLVNKDEKYYMIFVEFGTPTEDGSGYQYYDSFPDEDMFLDVEIQSPKKAVVGENIQFYCIVQNGTAPYTYSWELNGDDKPDSELQNPKYTFTEPGNYTITVLVTDDAGSMGYGETNITISSESSNGNQNNDKNGGSEFTLFIILIVIVVIAGIAVVVYLIRR